MIFGALILLIAMVSVVAFLRNKKDIVTVGYDLELEYYSKYKVDSQEPDIKSGGKGSLEEGEIWDLTDSVNTKPTIKTNIQIIKISKESVTILYETNCEEFVTDKSSEKEYEYGKTLTFISCDGDGGYQSYDITFSNNNKY